jgi:hypothetical protein
MPQKLGERERKREREREREKGGREKGRGGGGQHCSHCNNNTVSIKW